MDAEILLQQSRNPEAWLAKSVSLRASAQALWELGVASIPEVFSRAKRDGRTPSIADLNIPVGHMTVSQMLYGYAIETAFKAYILRTKPESVEIQIQSDGVGAV